MKKDTRNLLLIGAALLAVYLMTRQRQTTPTGYYPQQPPYNSPAWIQWAQTIVSAAGGLANDLFGPGGPFEGRNKAEVRDALEMQQALNQTFGG